MMSREYRDGEKLLQEAGPAMLPVLAEIATNEESSTWIVNRAAHFAARLPRSQTLREVLRVRRDDADFVVDPEGCHGICSYFASHGDATDLAWMQGIVESLDENDRNMLNDPIAKLRLRLGK